MAWRQGLAALAALLIVDPASAAAETAGSPVLEAPRLDPASSTTAPVPPARGAPISFDPPAADPAARQPASPPQPAAASTPASVRTGVPGGSAPSSTAISAKVEAALANALTLERPGQIGIATIWDGNRYVQCRLTADKLTLCEAAGTLMQPSLAHVVTPERVARLASLGWKLDTHFGNYVQVFPSNVTAGSLADIVMQALADGYGADLATLEVRSAWVDSDPCPPRNKPKQNLAGSINDSPAMEGFTIHACSYAPTPEAVIRSPADLIGVYGARVTGEVERLIVNHGDRVHLVLDSDTGYVQCTPDTPPPSITCEAASAESMPLLEQILTPERVARLHSLGFSDPGRGPNYFRATPLESAEAGTLAKELLTILYDVYGYRGRPKLHILTERGG